MNAEIINPFISGTLKVLETSASVESRPLKLYIKKDQTAAGDISGLINLSGELKGTISVTFTKEAILAIVSKMFMEEMTELNNDIQDAVGEISNQISGQANVKFVEIGKSLKAALSKVYMGKNHVIDHIKSHPILAIPFKTKDGKFIIEVSFEK
ncbi:MAG: chemotaxis protein CheX [Desulfobacterales bacterium]|nr:chemotaxis protein CheX [Desulfobacterales bacterium]MBF0395501.1 chemotaxis protein CheX [Desulfobacterales bacterium]